MKEKYFYCLCLLLICITLLVSTPVYASESQPTLLKQGMRGEAVQKVQSMLAEHGYYTDTVDGIFGISTHSAVIDFQLDNNLEPDGIVGRYTFDLLKNYRTSVLTSRNDVNRIGKKIAALAKSYLGVPYAWAGRSPGGFDCSGFVYYIYNQFGYAVPRMADEQFEIGTWISKRSLQPGDLVFFSTYEPGPSHVGIYIGAEQFIHASSGAGAVTITPLNKPYYFERYLGARRIVE